MKPPPHSRAHPPPAINPILQHFLFLVPSFIEGPVKTNLCLGRSIARSKEGIEELQALADGLRDFLGSFLL
jgi:hypothetical protein